jgi:iron complex transport system substrate-binding protein
MDTGHSSNIRKQFIMKACSFLPAATKMIFDMGLEELLAGVTFECPTESSGKPVVVGFLLERKKYSSAEIDRIFSASKAQGKSLYYVDVPLLQQLAPDIIFTQDVCEVCQIDTACTAAAIAHLSKQPQLISLNPSSLEDVFNSAISIASALGRQEAAYAYLSSLQKRIDHIIDELRKHRAGPKRVMLMEWIDPIYNCGHWIPFQIAFSGGIDMLSNPGGDSIVTAWDKILRYDPEILVIAPCGFQIDRAKEELYLLMEKKEWNQLRAVQDKKVFLADFDLFTQPCPGTLTDGIELLAAIFHPELFAIPDYLRKKQFPVFQSLERHVQS